MSNFSVPISPDVVARSDSKPGTADAIAIPALPDRQSRLRSIASHLPAWFILFAVAGLAHFTQYRTFGIYSDDQTFVVPPLTWHLHDVGRWINTQIRIYPEPQGRPLGFLIGLIIPYFGNQLGGLPGMFFIGWVILSVNSILFYHLLRRCLAPPLPFLGALFFLLFPADTTREFLCHAVILQPSLTFMLIAGHLYLTGQRDWQPLSLICLVTSYVMVTACLVTYETALLPFLAMPLLIRGARNSRWRLNAVIHAGIVLGIVGFVYFTRTLGHEYRTVEANASKIKTLAEIAGGTIIGPAAILEACLYRPWQAIRDLYYRPGEIVQLALVIGLFTLILWLAFRRQNHRDSNDTTQLPADIRRAGIFGLFATAVSYLFCFTHFPPGCIEGQETSVHLAAVVGAATLLAAIAAQLTQLRLKRANNIVRSHWKTISLLSIALYFSLIFKAALDEQRAYGLLWQQKQQFWTRLIDLCPDLNQGTMVICDGMLNQPVVDHRAVWFMPPNCWADSLVLQYSYKFPTSWKLVPQVSSFPAEATLQGWRTWLKRDPAGNVIWSKPPYGRSIGDLLQPGNTILLTVTPDGHITRRSGTIDIAGHPFKLADPIRWHRPGYVTLPLYTILTGAPATWSGE